MTTPKHKGWEFAVGKNVMWRIDFQRILFYFSYLSSWWVLIIIIWFISYFQSLTVIRSCDLMSEMFSKYCQIWLNFFVRNRVKPFIAFFWTFLCKLIDFFAIIRGTNLSISFHKWNLESIITFHGRSVFIVLSHEQKTSKINGINKFQKPSDI